MLFCRGNLQERPSSLRSGPPVPDDTTEVTERYTIRSELLPNIIGRGASDTRLELEFFHLARIRYPKGPRGEVSQFMERALNIRAELG